MAMKKSAAFRPGTRVRLTGGDNEEAIGLEGTIVEAPARTWDRSAAWRRGGAWVEWDGLADPSWEKLEWLTAMFEKVSPLWFFVRHVPSEDELRAEYGR